MARADRALQLEDGPWASLCDSGSYQPGKLRVAINIYPLDPAVGEGLTGRPGWSKYGFPAGSPFSGRVQGFVDFAGMAVCIAHGEIWRMVYGTGTWTLAASAANIVTAGAALYDAVGGVVPIGFLTVYVGGAARLFISDGINKPLLYDGTTGAASITPVPNCPILYGQPTMYEARVFGIKASNRRTMVWSESDDPLTGYEAGGFSNAWSLRQTDSHELSGLVGQNTGLLIFRERSTTSAAGDVGPNFSSASSRESISGTEGLGHPFSAVVVRNGVMGLDAQSRPQFYRNGAQGFTPVWHDLRAHAAIVTANMQMSTSSGLYSALAAEFSPLKAVFFLVAGTPGSTRKDQLWQYDVSDETPQPVATWTLDDGNPAHEFTAMAVLLAYDAVRGPTPTLVVGDSAGWTYALGDPISGTQWDDDWQGNLNQPIVHTLETGELGYTTKTEKIFDRVDLTGDPTVAMTGVSVQVRTPSGLNAAQTVTLPGGGDDAHTDVGIDAMGRWGRVRISHSTVGERFALSALTLSGSSSSADPEAK